jgi:hypothetical protein
MVERPYLAARWITTSTAASDAVLSALAGYDVRLRKLAVRVIPRKW